jgi:hypothetical protein
LLCFARSEIVETAQACRAGVILADTETELATFIGRAFFAAREERCTDILVIVVDDTGPVDAVCARWTASLALGQLAGVIDAFVADGAYRGVVFAGRCEARGLSTLEFEAFLFTDALLRAVVRAIERRATGAGVVKEGVISTTHEHKHGRKCKN